MWLTLHGFAMALHIIGEVNKVLDSANMGYTWKTRGNRVSFCPVAVGTTDCWEATAGSVIRITHVQCYIVFHSVPIGIIETCSSTEQIGRRCATIWKIFYRNSEPTHTSQICWLYLHGRICFSLVAHGIIGCGVKPVVVWLTLYLNSDTGQYITMHIASYSIIEAGSITKHIAELCATVCSKYYRTTEQAIHRYKCTDI